MPNKALVACCAMLTFAVRSSTLERKAAAVFRRCSRLQADFVRTSGLALLPLPLTGGLVCLQPWLWI